MATFPLGFRNASDQVHCDHEALIAELNDLDDALADLGGCSATFAYRAISQRIQRCEQRLSQLLPEHFVREETSLFETVARVSPELAEFAREMRTQHHALRGRLGEFSKAVQQLEKPADRTQAVEAVLDCGRALACELRSHVVLEESELSGFL